jgi:hypothetical protein
VILFFKKVYRDTFFKKRYTHQPQKPLDLTSALLNWYINVTDISTNDYLPKPEFRCITVTLACFCTTVSLFSVLFGTKKLFICTR